MKTVVSLLFVCLFIGSYQQQSITPVVSTSGLYSTPSGRESVDTVPTPTSRLLSTTVIIPKITSLPVINTNEQQNLTIVAANLSAQFTSGTINCECDLLVEQCDLLCCCDQDCTSSELRTFCCATSESAREVCLDFNGLLWTSLTQCSCEDLSLLCITREQEPSKLVYEATISINDSKQFQSEFLLTNVPGDNIPFQVQNTINFAPFYKIDNPVLAIQNETILGIFAIPGSLNGLQCHDSNPITYLRDEERKCERKLTPLNVTCISLSALHVDKEIFVAKVPIATIAGLQSNNSLVLATKSSVMCKIASGQLSPCQISLPVYENNTCNNALLQVTYTIIHNGSGQIIGVHIDILLGSIQSNQESYVQKYTIRFQNEEQEVSLSDFQRSGNPGYVVGQPVLAGSLSDVNIIDIAVRSSAWLSVRESNQLCNAILPTKVVQFREDLVTTCVFQVPTFDMLEDCNGVRRRAFEVLTPSPQLKYIGRFGDSDPRSISEWVQLINDTSPGKSDDNLATVGTLCAGIPTVLRISILYSLFGDYGSPQALISGVQFYYYTENAYNKLSESDTLLIPLKTSVTFIEIGAPPLQVLQTVSGTIRKLPHDFLYPLFLSQATENTISVINILAICHIVIVLSL